MLRKWVAAVVVGAFCSAIAGAEDKPDAGEKKPGKIGGADKAKLFAKIDANGDGKLSKAEFTTFLEGAVDRLKAAGKGEKVAGKVDAIAAKLFTKLDANGDGSVSREEFEKADLGAALKAKLGKKSE